MIHVKEKRRKEAPHQMADGDSSGLLTPTYLTRFGQTEV